MSEKISVLFVCIHNSARSQMAEAYLNALAGDRFVAESAGIEPGLLNQKVVKVMAEDGIDISAHRTKSVFEFYKLGRYFSFVITVCDKEAAERCPIFPGNVKRLHWSFKDPSRVEGDEESALEAIRQIRNEIKAQIMEFIGQNPAL